MRSYKSITELAAEWHKHKQDEINSQNSRRAVEDEILECMEVDNTQEGTTTIQVEFGELKIANRLNRTVNADELQEIALEHGLHDHLQSLFRWKPEINMKEWKSTDPSITQPLEAAITVKPSRPSFKILV